MLFRCWECDIASNEGTFTPFPHYWTACGSPGLAEERVRSAVGHRTVYLHRQDERQDPALSSVQNLFSFSSGLYNLPPKGLWLAVLGTVLDSC